MINKKKIMLAAAAVLLSLGMAATAMAAPGQFSVQADELEYDMKTGEGTAKGNVVLLQDGGKATADFAVFNSKSKQGTLKGNVVADRDGSHIVCDEFIVHNENDMSAVGNAVMSKGGRTLASSRVDYYKLREYAETAGGWAQLTDSDGSVVNAAKIDYDMKLGIANATGGVTINSSARKLTASADRAVYETSKNGYVELIGNAVATQDGNTVSGNKLRLTNTNVAIADGNVRVKYIPTQQPAVVNKEQASDSELA